MKYYSVKEVAEIIGVVEETVRVRLRNGEIVGVKPGNSRKWLISDKSINEYLKNIESDGGNNDNDKE